MILYLKCTFHLFRMKNLTKEILKNRLLSPFFKPEKIKLKVYLKMNNIYICHDYKGFVFSLLLNFRT